jgi:hypothetical protein
VALAEYFERDAQAVSQIVSGFDAEAFAGRIGGLEVGIAFGQDAVDRAEGVASLDLLVRLAARFYPAIAIAGPAGEVRDRLVEEARAINPLIELSTRRRPTTGVVVGSSAPSFRRSIYAGSNGWTGIASNVAPIPIGRSRDPFGAGVSACLAAGLLFRVLVLGQRPRREHLRFSAWSMGSATSESIPPPPARLRAALVGGGAIGNATAWALARTPDQGLLEIVDGEAIELSNLQRYVMAARAQEGAAKAPHLAGLFTGGLNARPFEGRWADFVHSRGYDHSAVLVALDSAEDRRAVQASVPGWIVNAWTQPGDLGVSVHSEFGGPGACLACLYLPDGRQPNEDEIYARALGVPERVAEIRTLLFHGGPVGEDLLVAVGAALARPPEVLAPFAELPIRDLYVRGICGGAVLPLGSTGVVRSAVHVPLAHQSALAGILLAASAVRRHRGFDPELTEVTTLDILRPIPPMPSHPVRAKSECFCRDADFVEAYRAKWRHGASRSEASEP